MRPRVLIDVDGPLTRGFFVKVCELLRAEGVTHAKPSAIDRWNVFESFGVSPEVERRVRERLGLPGIAKEFKPNTGAGPFLARLRQWADVYAVTAPLDGAPTWTHDREIWLFDRLGFTPERVIHARDKSIVGGDVFVDDRLANVEQWAAAHPGGLAVLWLEPHNEADALTWPRETAASYEHLEELFGPSGVPR